MTPLITKNLARPRLRRSEKERTSYFPSELVMRKSSLKMWSKLVKRRPLNPKLRTNLIHLQRRSKKEH